MSLDTVDLATVEQFLTREAWLLDDWRMDEWLGLFTPGARYMVPSTNLPADADPAEALFLINDDFRQLQYRVKRLFHPQGHAEQPHSVTQRLVTNVMLGAVADDRLPIRAAFLIARTRHEILDWFVGEYSHAMVLQDGELRFAERKALLRMPALRPVGTISIIV